MPLWASGDYLPGPYAPPAASLGLSRFPFWSLGPALDLPTGRRGQPPLDSLCIQVFGAFFSFKDKHLTTPIATAGVRITTAGVFEGGGIATAGVRPDGSFFRS